MVSSVEIIHPNLAGHTVLVVESDWILNPIKSELEKQAMRVTPQLERDFNFYELSTVFDCHYKIFEYLDNSG